MSIERPKPSGPPVDLVPSQAAGAGPADASRGTGPLAAASSSDSAASSAALHGATATREVEQNAEIAAELRAGSLDAASAQLRLIEQAVDQLATGANEQQRAAIRELVSASIGNDPHLAALLDTNR